MNSITIIIKEPDKPDCELKGDIVLIGIGNDMGDKIVGAQVGCGTYEQQCRELVALAATIHSRFEIVLKEGKGK